MSTHDRILIPGTAIVTGGSRGFGKALASSLVDRQWRVVIDARDGSELAKAKRDIGGADNRVLALAGDVRDENHRRDLVAAASRIGNLRLLVNNASTLGISPLPPVAEYDPSALLTLFETNVVSPVRLAQLALPELGKSKGVIVNVSSDAAVAAYAGWGAYGASKAALDQVSRVMSAEEPDVRIYAFDPGDMRTRMHQDAFPGEDISDRPLPESRVPSLIDLIGSDRPSGRYTADELLELVSP